MQFRTVSAAATLVIGALVTSATAPSPTTGPANAQPAAAPEPAAPSLAYSAKLVDKTVVTTLEGGTFELSRRPRHRSLAHSRSSPSTW